jgi:hypothetical protein
LLLTALTTVPLELDDNDDAVVDSLADVFDLDIVKSLTEDFLESELDPALADGPAWIDARLRSPFGFGLSSAALIF